MSVVDYVYELERPLCSMSFNGIIFEEEIPGYRTLRVEGRDPFNQTIYEYSTRLNPGSRFQDWHEEPKEITVTFALVSTSAEDLRKKLDKIKGILRDKNNREAQIIFNDEPDFYYTGSVSRFTEEKLVSIEHSAGQIVIRCTDVRKKSVEEYSLVADAESNYQFTLDYPGSMPSYPKFKATIASNTDFIAFVDQDENMLQFGSSSETGAEKAAPSTVQIDQFFKRDAQSGWVYNQATVSTDCLDHTQHGSMGRDTARGMYPSNYGTFDPETMASGWHGPTMTHTVGTNGAKNWKLTAAVTQWQNTPTVGGIEVLLINEYQVFACEGNSHFFNKNVNVYFAAYEGNKRIPCKVNANVSLFDVTSSNVASTASSSGVIKWTIKKGTTISAASGSVTVTFVVTSPSTGLTMNINKQIHWSKQTIPAKNKFDVLFDYTSFNMPVKSGNKLFVGRTLILSFGGYYGTTRCNIECTNSPSAFGVRPSSVTKGNKGNGSITWGVKSNTVISSTSVTLTFKITVPGKKTSTTISKTFNFTRYNIQETRKDYSQRGEIQLIVAGTNYNNEMQSIAEVHLFKNATASTGAKCYLYLDDRHVRTLDYKCEKNNPFTGGTGGAGATVTIEKIDNKYTFTVGREKYQFSNANNLIATEVSVWFNKFQNTNVLERNAVHSIKFIKHADTVNKASLIPNKFTKGDVVEIDTETGEVLVNGAPEYGYGALGNDWEDFCLKPGTNEIQCAWDQSATTEPTFEMLYREVN